MLNQKQKEWDCQADSTENVGMQVCRPINEKDWGILLEDLYVKLDIINRLESILDIGCGNAFLLSEFKKYFKECYGIDYSFNMIERAKIYFSEGIFDHCEACDINFEDNKFDRVFAYSIVHYFSDEQYLLKVIDEMIRVCKKGGIVLIGDILDKNFEDAIKKSSDLEYEKKIPSIQRYSEWYFCDLEKLRKYIEGKNVKKVEILDQTSKLKYCSYRKDLKISL